MGFEEGVSSAINTTTDNRARSLVLIFCGGVEPVVDAEAEAVFNAVISGAALGVEEILEHIVEAVGVREVSRGLSELVLVVRVRTLLDEELCDFQPAVLCAGTARDERVVTSRLLCGTGCVVERAVCVCVCVGRKKKTCAA